MPLAERWDLSAKVQAGADGINRNYLVPGAPAWSWHVTEFAQFFQIFGGIPDTPQNLKRRIYRKGIGPFSWVTQCMPNSRVLGC